MRPWLALDLETAGTFKEYALQPWRVKQRKAYISTIAWTVRGSDEALMSDGLVYPTREQIRAVLQCAVSEKMRVVTWNGKFDIAWLIAYGCGDLVDTIDWLDAMLIWKHYDMVPTYNGRSSYKLKGEEGGVETWAPHMKGYDDGVDYQATDRAGLEALLTYNMKDTEATLLIGERVWASLDEPRRKVIITESFALPMVARANVEGMHVNRAAVDKLCEVMDKQRDDALEKLKPHGVDEIVVRSTKKLPIVMFDQWNLPQIDGRSTAAETLEELVLVDDRAGYVGDLREALNLKGKFAGSLINSTEYNGDNKTHPDATIFGTYTGRLTYSSSQTRKEGSKTKKNKIPTGFPLHQMKNDKDWRSTIVAPPRHLIVEADAAGQEFRWMAIKANDDVMLGLCLPGEDAHSYMGSECFPDVTYEQLRDWHKTDDPLAKKPRKMGKVANLSLQYRTSDKTFRIRARTDYGLHLSADEAKNIVSAYRRSYLGVPKYWQAQIALGKKLGYAENLAGRRVRVEGSWIGPMKWAMESTMINYPIQSTGGDQKFLALRVLKTILAEYGARFAWDLHDGIYFYCPEATAMKFAVRMRHLLDNLPYTHAWGLKPPIPLPWDCKIGPTWGSLKGIE